MPLKAAGLRYPHERTFLPRTKLAYVHLRNLLTDAKRDRAARVFGYVAIWLPEELVLLYMQEGEVVNATTTPDGRAFEVLSIAEAIARVPTEPEIGEVTFQEADDEQLACMFQAQSEPCDPWPDELNAADARALFPYLASTTYDGTVEIAIDQAVHYLVVRDGAVHRAFLSDGQEGAVVERVKRLFLQDARRGEVRVRRWPVPQPLQVQAAPALIQAYRELGSALVRQLVAHGSESAPAVAEHAKQQLASRHPWLAVYTLEGKTTRDPVVDGPALTRGFAAWAAELLWAAPADSVAPETLLRDLTRDRRHMFQSAGLFDALPWKMTW